MPTSENIPDGKDYVGFYLSKAVHKKLRLLAADSATTKSEIVENSLLKYFEDEEKDKT